MNYLAHPHKSAKHLLPIATPIDFHRRRALILDGSENARVILTTVQDLANIVVAAVEYEGIWPLVGGIKGDSVTVGELLDIGERIRGTSLVNDIRVVPDALLFTFTHTLGNRSPIRRGEASPR